MYQHFFGQFVKLILLALSLANGITVQEDVNWLNLPMDYSHCRWSKGALPSVHWICLSLWQKKYQTEAGIFKYVNDFKIREKNIQK